MAHRLNSRIALTSLGLLLAAGHAQAQAQLDIFTSTYIGYGVSGNGQWAVLGTGSPVGGTDVYLWSAATHSLTDIGGFAGTAGSLEISADGSSIAAQSKDINGVFQSSVYNANKGSWSVVPALGGTDGGSTGSITWGMSANGRYVGGTAYAPGSSNPHGFVTDTLTGAVTDLGATEARVAAISPDGSILVGYNTNARRASEWTRNSDGSYTQRYFTQPGAPTQGLNETIAMSTNGLWAAGSSFNTTLPYRVDLQTGQIQYYDKLPIANFAGKSNAVPGAISADGMTIVGIHSPQSASLGGSYGYIWKGDGTVNGNMLGGTVETFDDYLAGFGIDTANHYNFLSIIGMNDDATVFTGIAVDNLTGGPVSFVVTVPVPEPSQYALLASGLALVGWVARRRRTAK